MLLLSRFSGSDRSTRREGDYGSPRPDGTTRREGIYRIDYTVALRPVDGRINAAYAVAINGLENPLSFFGMYSDHVNNTDRTELVGMFVASIPAGVVVTLRNKSLDEDHLAGTGVDHQAVNHTSILLQRIA